MEPLNIDMESQNPRIESQNQNMLYIDFKNTIIQAIHPRHDE